MLPVELKKTFKTMSKNQRKRVTHTQREEQQGKKVMLTFTVIALILIVIMLVAYTIWA